MRILDRIKGTVRAVQTLRETGLLAPKMAITATKALRQMGTTVGTGYVASAMRSPDMTGIIDDEGPLSFGEIDEQSDRLAIALAGRGVGPEVPVGLLARNSRWFVIANVALNKLGATVLYMNTGFAGPQLVDVMEREGGVLLIHDDEFTEAVVEHAPDLARIVAHGAGSEGAVPSLAEMIADTAHVKPFPPERHGRQVILTSGTTGTPKGASRSNESATDLEASTALFQRVPFRVHDVHVIPAPVFHSLGNGALLTAGQFTQTAVMTRRFDPQKILELITEHRVRSMTVVPVMLQRMLDLPDEVKAAQDTSSLEVVWCSGSALPGSLALRWMDTFGDNLYNMYGSTEFAIATVATPEDLRAAPGTAGKPVAGVEVRLYDEDDQEVTEPGRDGRIFVGSALRFDGYTGGETKPSIDGLLSSGDLGHFDEEGRLYVGGRDDDMIVSGGENLFPREVEDLLADHEAVEEVAVIGVDDEEFGKRLAAFVVAVEGATLSADDVKAHVKTHLANYKVPRSVTFLDQLPRNATGKVLKRDLQEDA